MRKKECLCLCLFITFSIVLLIGIIFFIKKEPYNLENTSGSSISILRYTINDIIVEFKYRGRARPYRLGDVVKGNPSFTKISKLNIRKYYKDSIANTYLETTYGVII